MQQQHNSSGGLLFPQACLPGATWFHMEHTQTTPRSLPSVLAHAFVGSIRRRWTPFAWLHTCQNLCVCVLQCLYGCTRMLQLAKLAGWRCGMRNYCVEHVGVLGSVYAGGVRKPLPCCCTVVLTLAGWQQAADNCVGLCVSVCSGCSMSIAVCLTAPTAAFALVTATRCEPCRSKVDLSICMQYYPLHSAVFGKLNNIRSVTWYLDLSWPLSVAGCICDCWLLLVAVCKRRWYFADCN